MWAVVYIKNIVLGKMIESYSVNKKSKMINTYGKSRPVNIKRTSQFTGSLSDRLQLIDTTPTGEDPYQLGEADMREQSPIPKLMLQKTNHGRMKVCTDPMGDSTITPRRIYASASTVTGSTKDTSKARIDRFDYDPYPSLIPKESIKTESPKTLIIEEPDLDIVKTEPDIDWGLCNTDKPTETSLCDFSYGENPDNLASQILPGVDLASFYAESPLPLDNLDSLEFETSDKPSNDKSTMQAAHDTSLVDTHLHGVSSVSKINVHTMIIQFYLVVTLKYHCVNRVFAIQVTLTMKIFCKFLVLYNCFAYVVGRKRNTTWLRKQTR